MRTPPLFTLDPDGLGVLDAQVAAEGEAAIVLLEPPAGTGQVKNLVIIQADAHISWRGELPSDDPSDCFVSFSLEAGGDVSAETWSGYWVLLSGHTGRILSKQFVK